MKINPKVIELQKTKNQDQIKAIASSYIMLCSIKSSYINAICSIKSSYIMLYVVLSTMAKKGSLRKHSDMSESAFYCTCSNCLM